MGARIVLVARDRARGEATLSRLRSQNPHAEHRVHFADLSRLPEMKRVAQEIAGTEPHIHVLMNNAGAMFDRLKITEDSLELTFALNHMAYFVITGVLRERLLSTPGARIINTSSDAHRKAHIDYGSLQMTSGYGMFKAYCRTKLYNVLFTRELSRQFSNTDVTANAFHPGFVGTRFGEGAGGIGGLVFRAAKRFALTPEQGAETLIHLASSNQVSGVSGEYFHKCAPVRPTDDALDDAAAKWLWAESERLAKFSLGQ